MTFFTGTGDHTPATTSAMVHGDVLRADTYWTHWEQSEYSLGRVNCDAKGAMWDWEDRVDRNRELGQPSHFSGEAEVQRNEDIDAALNSGITTAALFSCPPATQGDPVPTSTEQSLEKQRMSFEQRVTHWDRANETYFTDKTTTHCKDLDEQKLQPEEQSSRWNVLFGLDHAKGKRIQEGVNCGKAIMDQRENGSIGGCGQVTNHHTHAQKSTGNQTVVFLGPGGRLRAAISENSAKFEPKEIKSSSEAEISDSRIDLKLGNCAYVDDTAVVPVVKYASPTITPAKKQRISPAAQVPRCQVEGCKLELTAEKEYHRRHKVCATHSKSPKVIVASLEQRFCQQCSRFHVLSEFDEGKRSCRRRLAGHNERRRKPQPDHFLLTSGGSSFFQENRNAINMTGERHSLIQHPGQAFTNSLCETDGGHRYGKSTWSKFGSLTESPSLAYQLQSTTGMERFVPHISQSASDKLYMLLQPPSATSMALKGGDRAKFQQSSGSLGHGLTLSSSSAGLRGLQGTQVSHRCTLDSDCALSLLSSHPWSSKASTSSVSLDVSPKSDLTLEQMIAENRATFAPHFSPRSSTEFQQELSQSVDKCFTMLPNSQENGIVSSAVSFPALSSSESAQHQAPFSLMQNLDGQSILSILQGNEFRALQDGNSQQTKPTIDLLTFPSPQTRHMQRTYDSGLTESASGQYNDIQPLRFESSMFDSS